MVPMSELKTAIELLDRELEVYPLWLCPFKLLDQPGILRSQTNRDEMFINLGVYGIPQQVIYRCLITHLNIINVGTL